MANKELNIQIQNLFLFLKNLGVVDGVNDFADKIKYDQGMVSKVLWDNKSVPPGMAKAIEIVFNRKLSEYDEPKIIEPGNVSQAELQAFLYNKMLKQEVMQEKIYEQNKDILKLLKKR